MHLSDGGEIKGVSVVRASFQGLQAPQSQYHILYHIATSYS